MERKIQPQIEGYELSLSYNPRQVPSLDKYLQLSKMSHCACLYCTVDQVLARKSGEVDAGTGFRMRSLLAVNLVVGLGPYEKGMVMNYV